MAQRRAFTLAFKLIVPFFVWVWLARNLLFGSGLIRLDTFEVYANLQYYLDSLRHGVMPFWDPFTLWGAPFEMALSVMGAFNPMVLVILLLDAIGLSFHQAFMMYLALNFFLAAFGVFRLARLMFEDGIWAYLAYLGFLFSSAGMVLFSQILMLLIFVPAVWFFYFLLRFFRYRDRLSYVGMSFTLMVQVSTYLPFYFLTAFAIFVLFFLMVWPRKALGVWIVLRQFVRKHTRTAVVGLTGVLIAAAPSFMAFKTSQGTDIVVPSRHHQDASLEQGVVMNYPEAGSGGFSAKTSPREWFAHFKALDYRNDGIFYVPLWIWLVLALGLAVRPSGTSFILAGSAGSLWLVGLGDASMAHRFLYDHIGFFRLFRNSYFFLPFLLATVILLGVEQLRLLFDRLGQWRSKPLLSVLWIVTGHALFAVFLFLVGARLWTTAATVAASLGVFLFYARYRPDHRGGWLPVMLVIVMMAQPLEVGGLFFARAKAFDEPVIRRALAMEPGDFRFDYQRPDLAAMKERFGTDDINYDYLQNWHRIAKVDSPGFLAHRHGYPTRLSYALSRNMDRAAYGDYVRQKFWVYSEENGVNRLVFRRPEELTVIGFNANSLRVHVDFPAPRLVVYNDSYHSRWCAFIDGQPVPVFLTNFAFKGVHVPAGQHLLYLRYTPMGGETMYWLVWMFMLMFGGYFVLLTVREGRLGFQEKDGD